MITPEDLIQGLQAYHAYLGKQIAELRAHLAEGEEPNEATHPRLYIEWQLGQLAARAEAIARIRRRNMQIAQAARWGRRYNAGARTTRA